MSIQAYIDLATDALSRRLLRWPSRPKFHAARLHSGCWPARGLAEKQIHWTDWWGNGKKFVLNNADLDSYMQLKKLSIAPYQCPMEAVKSGQMRLNVS